MTSLVGQLLGFLAFTLLIAVLYVGNCWLHHRARHDETTAFVQPTNVRVLPQRGEQR